MRAAKIVLLVVGGIILLTSFGLLVGGAVLYRVNTSLTDSQGYISSAGQRFTVASYAIATQDVNIKIGTGTDWGIWRPSLGDLITVRITASSNSPADNVFIGIANVADAQAYLSNVQYDEIVRLEFNPGSSPNIEYRPHQGSTTPANPLSQTLWASSAHGVGTQTLEWTPQTGTYWIVLMDERSCFSRTRPDCQPGCADSATINDRSWVNPRGHSRSCCWDHHAVPWDQTIEWTFTAR